MFRSGTVLVLGAGASAEVGLPVGSGLLSDIVDRLNLEWGGVDGLVGDDSAINKALEEHFHGNSAEINRHISAGYQICKSATQARSVDYIIDALEDSAVELTGKLAIASSILSAERESPWFQPVDKASRLDLSRFTDTWYNDLTQLLVEGMRKSHADQIFENLEIISFNYDRCIERYLPQSLASYFGDRTERFQEIAAASLRIHRPFGSVGKLPWEGRLAPSLGFGQTSHHRLVDAANEIRTFTERMDDEVALNAMRQAISEAERIVFLGFAFHRQNLELITPPMFFDSIEARRLVLATVMGISESDQAAIREEVGAAMEIPELERPTEIRLSEMTCREFFQEHWRTLTA